MCSSPSMPKPLRSSISAMPRFRSYWSSSIAPHPPSRPRGVTVFPGGEPSVPRLNRRNTGARGDRLSCGLPHRSRTFSLAPDAKQEPHCPAAHDNLSAPPGGDGRIRQPDAPVCEAPVEFSLYDVHRPTQSFPWQLGRRPPCRVDGITQRAESPMTRVKRITQRIPYQGNAEHEQRERHAGKERQPRRRLQKPLGAFLEHSPP